MKRLQINDDGLKRIASKVAQEDLEHPLNLDQPGDDSPAFSLEQLANDIVWKLKDTILEEVPATEFKWFFRYLLEDLTMLRDGMLREAWDSHPEWSLLIQPCRARQTRPPVSCPK